MQRLDKYDRAVDWLEPLHDIAREETGLDDFGDEHYLEGLKVLLEQYDMDCDLSPMGVMSSKMKMVHVLKRRLLAEQAWKDDPSVLDIPIEKPLVITGLVRTGSTALHYLLGSDPDRQFLPYWLSEHPQPRPPEDTWQDHPDYQQSKGAIDMTYEIDPSLKAIHFMSPDWPEECGHLMAQNFTDDYWEGATRVPHYLEWYKQKSLVETYRRHKKLLQLIGSTQPEMPWLIKYPVHMKHLRSFLEIYPDARVIWTHRDPSNVLSSYASLIAGFRKLNCNAVDHEDIVQEQMESWAAAADRAIEIRSEHDPAQFYDLHFEDFVGDSVAAARRIYDSFGIEWTDRAEIAMREHHADNQQGKHGKHDHSLGVLETSRQAMLDRFANYIEHFGVNIT
ncbi:MAG: sulfotransferase [Myxococcota bacterium]|jgi:hypothetical protein|nr:sulfotransferase [Myxococcota bacterium]